MKNKNIDQKLKISDLIFIKKDSKFSENTPGIVLSNPKKVSGVGYVISILTNNGVFDILRENIYKK